MIPSSQIARGQWHKKAKWMLKKVLIKPPTNSTQMRDLCNDIIEQRHGINARSTAVVSTALSLWDDENLVNALQKNQTFLNAKERIQNLSGHILPSQQSNASTSLSAPTSPTIGNDSSSSSTCVRRWSAPPTPHHSLLSAVQEVLHCPVCGRNVHCLHDEAAAGSFASTEGGSLGFHHHPVPHDTNTITEETEDFFLKSEKGEEEENPNFTKGTAGVPPPDSEFSSSSSESVLDALASHSAVLSSSFNHWFGPLVLASLAVVGLAVGVFNGEIVIPRLQSLSSRALAAVTMLLQASNSLFHLLEPK